jgi:hypothetical protein
MSAGKGKDGPVWGQWAVYTMSAYSEIIFHLCSACCMTGSAGCVCCSACLKVCAGQWKFLPLFCIGREMSTSPTSDHGDHECSVCVCVCCYRLASVSSNRPVKIRKLDADTHVVYTPTDTTPTPHTA